MDHLLSMEIFYRKTTV